MRTFRNIVLSATVALGTATGSLANDKCDPVNVNTAEARTIADSLFRVGPVKSAAIVAHRETNGTYETVESLDDVFGIGPGIIGLNEGCILLSDS